MSVSKTEMTRASATFVVAVVESTPTPAKTREAALESKTADRVGWSEERSGSARTSRAEQFQNAEGEAISHEVDGWR